MRISVNQNDPGYSEAFNRSSLQLICKIEGKRVTQVITVDDCRGYIKRYVTHEKTGKILRYGDTEKMMTEELYGNVSIHFKEFEPEDFT